MSDSPGDRTWLTSGGRYGKLEYEEDLQRIIIEASEPHHPSTRLSVPLDVLIQFLSDHGFIEEQVVETE